jgi:hygromycin-B 7''-O-kinase
MPHMKNHNPRRPEIPSLQDYCRVFTDLTVWRSLVEAVCARHHLSCRVITSGTPGTHVVFLVDGRFAIKIYSSFFDGIHSYRVERDIYGLIARHPHIPAPPLVAHGELFPGEDGWPYPYVVTEVIPGVPLAGLPDSLWQRDGAAIAAYLGDLMRQLHALPLDGLTALEPTWEAFAAFVTRQRQQYTGSGFAPPRGLDHLRDDCAAQLVDLIDRSRPPCLVHADITRDHVLGRLVQGHWQPTGLIDFGDARTGDPVYEFIALHLDVFRGDKRLLKSALDAYGEIPPDFVRRATALTLLHEFDVLAGVPFDLRSVPDFETFGAQLWDVTL